MKIDKVIFRECFKNDHIWISIFSLEQQVLVHWCIWFLRRLNPNRALLEISKQNRKKLKKIFTEIINTWKNHYVIDYVSIRQVVGYITNASRATLFRTNKKILMCPLYCSLKEKWKWLGRITSLLRYFSYLVSVWNHYVIFINVISRVINMVWHLLRHYFLLCYTPPN